MASRATGRTQNGGPRRARAPQAPAQVRAPQSPYLRLERALSHGLTHPHADLKLFWDAWAQTRLGRTWPALQTLDDFAAACTGEGGALAPLYHLESTVGSLSISKRPVWQMAPPARELIRALALALGEAHCHECDEVCTEAPDGVLRVHAEDGIVGDLTATARLKAGTQVGRDGQGRAFVLNVIGAVDALELAGSGEDMVTEACSSALARWAETVRDDPQALKSQALATRVGAQSATDPSMLRLLLRDVQERHGLQPVIKARHPDGALLTLADNVARLRGLGGELVRIEPVSTADAARALALQHYADRVQRTVLKILSALDPPKEVPMPPTAARSGVFVSYAHKDGTAWMERVQTMLKALPPGAVTFWDDTQIKPGDDWPDEIDAALSRAACAVFILTSGFLGSSFCQTQEVPRLLAARDDEGVLVIPVVARPCPWKLWPPFKNIQALAQGKALSAMQDHEVDQVLTDLVEQIHGHLNPSPKS